MSSFFVRKFLVGTSLCLITVSAFAWQHGVSIGYGQGPDTNHPTYTNSGGFLSAQIMKLKTNNEWYNITMDGSLGDWHTNEPLYQNLWTAALTFAFQAYIFYSNDVHPYVAFSSGPAFISSRSFGYNSQGANVDFQTSLTTGIELGTKKRANVSLKWVHFSSCYIFRPNKGFNILPILSVGYLF